MIVVKSGRATPYLFLAPFMVTFTVFFVAPVLYAIYLSLFIPQQVNGNLIQVFGGLQNYEWALQDNQFLKSFVHIFFFGIIQIPIMLLLATILALILDQMADGFLKRFFRTAFYLPYTIPSVISGLLWGYLYSLNLSPLNYIIQQNGGQPINFLASTPMTLFVIGNIVTWTWVGYNMVVLFASLQGVPRELYDAAKVDGATGWNVIRYIKLPLLRPALFLTLLFSIIGTSQIFAEPFALRSIGFVPNDITPNAYLYAVGAQNGNYSYAAALALVLAAVTFIFSSFFLRIIARNSNDQ